MKRVLIVGKNSYIGNCLEDWLTQKHINEYSVDKISVRDDEWKSLDLSKYDVILYLSGMVHIKEKKEMWPEYVRLNAELPFEFARKSKACGVPYFVFFSTKGVYRPNTEFIDKKTVPVPQKLYGNSKLEGEKNILTLANENFKISVLRSPVVYGEGCKGNFPKLVDLSKRIHIFPRIYNKRSMIYIWNLCEFVRRLIEKPLPDPIVFPQDKDVFGVTDLMIALWEERKEKYYLSYLLAFIVRLLLKLNVSKKLNTMFLDTVYENEMSSYYNYEYCVFSFREAIKHILSSAE
ncbi:MAG: sugar nucleotide-binding protein [Ruminococcus sp.]|nr:sugar nucleotide-binding protein [Ruminococcus sp.]